MTVVDTSIIFAAFASWHEQHNVADDTVATGVRLVAHCAVEAFSVLTRLPPPHRALGHLARDFLAARFLDPYVAFDANGHRVLIPQLVELGISGGAVYDALVAATASAAGEMLVSCDRRAVQIYERLGVDYRLALELNGGDAPLAARRRRLLDASAGSGWRLGCSLGDAW